MLTIRTIKLVCSHPGSESDLSKIVSIASKKNILIISDEIHSDIIFKGSKFNSLLTQEYEHSISLVGSPAKTFGMQSISTGFIYTENTKLLRSVSKTVESLALDHGNAFSTFATIAAYKKGEKWLDGFIEYMEANVKWIDDYISKELPMIKLFIPEGTYQVWLDFSDLALDKEQLNTLLAHKAKMGLTPGRWFGVKGSFYRMNIATNQSVIQQSFFNLKSAVNELSLISDNSRDD